MARSAGPGFLYISMIQSKQATQQARLAALQQGSPGSSPCLAGGIASPVFAMGHSLQQLGIEG